jgi:tetratricopeptide (TPR) repeat protein
MPLLKMTHRLKFIFSILVFAVFGQTVQAQQQDVEAKVFRDRDSITIFIPKVDGTVSLADVQMQFPEGIGGRRGLTLATGIPAFAGVTFENVPTPICLRLVRDSAQPLAPLDCLQGLIFTQGLVDADVFWVDQAGNELTIFLHKDGQDLLTCPAGNNQCPFRLTISVQVNNGPHLTPPADGFANLGIENLRQGHYPDAISAFTNYINLLPNDPSGYLLRALTRVFEKSYQAAVQDFDQALALDSTNYYAYIGRGKINLIEGSPQASVDDFSRAIQILPDSAEGYYLRGRAYRELREFDLAIQDFQAAGDRGMSTAAILTEIGRTQLDRNDPESALNTCTEALTINPNQRLAYQCRSRAHRLLGNDEQALADANSAIEVVLVPTPASITPGTITPTPTAPVIPATISVPSAISLFTAAISIDVGQDVATLFCDRGEAHLSKDEINPAITDFEQARALDNEAACAYTGLANAYSLLGAVEQVRTNAGAATALEPSDPTIFNNVGVAYMNIQFYQDARSHFTRATELDPAEALYFINRGTANLNLGDNQQAANDYRRAIDLGDTSADTFFNLGVALLKLNDLINAEINFTRAIEIDPSQHPYFANRGIVYFNLGDFQRAILDFGTAIGLGSDEAGLYYNRGLAHMNLRQYQEAIPDFDVIIAHEPDNARAYGQRATAYFNLGNYPQAITDYDRAISLAVDDFFYYANRGLAYLNLENYEEAVADFNKAIDLGINDTSVFYNLGLAYMNLENYQQAIASFNEALAREPNNPNYVMVIGDAQLGLDNFQQAIQEYDRAESLGSRDAGLYNNRGVAKLNLGQLAGAALDFRQAITLDPSVAFYHYNYADALIRQNRGDCNALQSLRDYVQLAGPGADPQAQTLIAQLEQDCS